MGRLAIAFLLASPVLAARQRQALTSSDELLLAKMGLRQAYDAMWEFQPEIDRLVLELQEIQRGYGGKLEAQPGGPRRTQVEKELSQRLAETWKRRQKFRDLGVDLRLGSVVTMAFGAKNGKPEAVNMEVQAMLRHDVMLEDFKAYFSGVEAALGAERKSFQEAVRRYEASQAERRRTIWGAGLLGFAVLAAAAAFFLKSRAASAPDRQALGAPPPAAQPGVGRYRLGRQGRPWAFGERFEAVEDGSGRAVSLGRLDQRYAPRPADAERIIARLSAAASLRHPVVPALVEAFAESGNIYLVTAAVSGKPLSAWLELGKAIKIVDAVRALRPVADALDCAHRAGLIHGALTPERILLGAEGAAVLEDFGLASICAPRGRGDPAYMAPEQELQRASPQSDAYSLGIVLYEMLTGSHPFAGVNLQAMKREMRFTPPSQALPCAPPKLDALFAGLLAADPALRRPLPGGLSAALEGLLG